MPDGKKLKNALRKALILEARAGLIPASDAIDEVHRSRMKRIGRVVRAYAKQSGSFGNRDHLAITDVLAHLRHDCDESRLEFHELDVAAEQQYLEV